MDMVSWSSLYGWTVIETTSPSPCKTIWAI